MRTVLLFLTSLFIMMEQAMGLSLSSSAFQPNQSIPTQYTCEGQNISPPLEWSGVPEGTKTFVIICDDPDVPPQVRSDRMYDHWVLFNIPLSVTSLSENAFVPTGATQGKNTSQKLGYTGPCPPDRQHRYFFKLYALDIALDLPEGSTKTQVEEAMKGHILDQTELMGTYVLAKNRT